MTPTPSTLTLWDTRHALLFRLGALEAPEEVRSTVSQDSYSLSLELGRDEGRAFLDRALGVLVFLGERGATEEEVTLASSYFAALTKCAARLGQQKKNLSRRPERARMDYVREVEQSAPVPSTASRPLTVVGPDDERYSYGDVARRRERSDGPDEHYLRDYRLEFTFENVDGIASLPCVACTGRCASDSCAPECSVPGGLCGAIWFKPTPPAVLGPHWTVFQSAFRALRREVAKDHGGEGGPDLHNRGGRKKKPSPDTLELAMQLIMERGVAGARVELEDRQYRPDEIERLIREGLRRLDGR